jgi:hypothetical protein
MINTQTNNKCTTLCEKIYNCIDNMCNKCCGFFCCIFGSFLAVIIGIFMFILICYGVGLIIFYVETSF